MNIKNFLKRNCITKNIYKSIKDQINKRQKLNKLRYTGSFVNRSKGEDKLCIVLAGYKPYLYNYVFARLKKYAIDKMDICIVTSGKTVAEIGKICEENEWSYLSTKENNVSLVQNVAIANHPKAKYIFKLDEDIFITEHFFEKMIASFERNLKGFYDPGFVAPIIPINGFAHIFVLEKYKKVEEYNNRFEKARHMSSPSRKIECDPAVARFFWGENGCIPHIDLMNKDFEADKTCDITCPIKFSIGAIFFPRSTWENMGYFSVNRAKTSLGDDEKELCAYCMLKSKPIIVNLNTVVGHFSFGKQTSGMIEYMNAHPEMFNIIN